MKTNLGVSESDILSPTERQRFKSRLIGRPRKAMRNSETIREAARVIEEQFPHLRDVMRKRKA